MPKKILLILISILLISGVIPPLVNGAEETVAYDGIWFLGFNLHKDIFNDKNVRQAIGMAVDRQKIIKIIGESQIPNGPIPPGMLGYSSKSKDFTYNVSRAKQLLKKAGYALQDERLKTLSLLHTDGVKTAEIAKEIKRNLINLGIKLELVRIPYEKQALWQQKLESGRYHLFLLGYKGEDPTIFIGDKSTKYFHKMGCKYIPAEEGQLVFFNSYADASAKGYRPDSFCDPQKEITPDPFSLLSSLFHSQGGANFTFYQHSRVDKLLDQADKLDRKETEVKSSYYAEIEEILNENPPVLTLFYISRL